MYSPLFSGVILIYTAEKALLEADGPGEEKTYQVEAKRLLDNVISLNKDGKAVPPLFVLTELMKVECRRRACRRTISRSSSTDGILF